MSQRNVAFGTKFYWHWLFLAFLVHWFFCAYTKIGVDYDRYNYIISVDCERRLLSGEEVGFNGLSMLLFKMIHNADICIYLYKTVTLILFYYSFYLLRDRAHLWLCIFAFNVHTYFAGYYIIAMQIAVALVFLASVLILKYNWKLIPLLLSIIASTFHTSAVMMTVCFLVVFAFNSNNKRIGIGYFALVGVICIVALVFVKDLFRYALSNYELLESYEDYENANKGTGSGMFNYILYSFLLLYVLPLLKSSMESYVVKAIVVFYAFSFLFSIMGYLFGIARLNSYNVVFTEVAIPFVFYQKDIFKLKFKWFFSGDIEKGIWIVYLLFIGWTALVKYASPASVNELNKWVYFNPF